MALNWSKFHTAFIIATLSTTPLFAQEVELVSEDESVRIKGELVGFEDGNYTIKTTLGELVLSAEQLNCVGENCPFIKPPAEEFAVSGPAQMGEQLLPGLLDAFSRSISGSFNASDHPTEGKLYVVTDNESDEFAKVQILNKDSSTGLVDLLQGDTRIALSTRSPRGQESEAFEKFGMGSIESPSQEKVIALDALTFITAAENPVKSITMEDAASIFAGRITNWAELGGPDAQISLYVPNPETGSSEMFDTFILAPLELELDASVTVAGDDMDVAIRVETDPSGIGFTSILNTQQAQTLAIEGSCGLKSHPSLFSVKSEEYPLTQRHFFYMTDEERSENFQGFLNFITSDEAQSVVQNAGYISHEIASESVEGYGARFASVLAGLSGTSDIPAVRSMADVMLNGERLSTTFRFNEDGNTLDNRSAEDLSRLAAHLASDVYRGKTVQIMGFGSSQGDGAADQQLSQTQAETVLDGLLERNPTLNASLTLSPSVGYGNISPIACNDTPEGVQANTRVEVWVQN